MARKHLEMIQYSHVPWRFQPSDPAAPDPTALGSSGTHWHLVLPTCVQLIPTSKLQSQYSWSWGVPPSFPPCCFHGMIQVGSDPKAPFISIPRKVKSWNWGKNQGIKAAKWRRRSVPASATSKPGDPELWNNNGSSVTWQDLELFLFQEQWIWHWNSAAFLSKGIKCLWQQCQHRFSAMR